MSHPDQRLLMLGRNKEKEETYGFEVERGDTGGRDQEGSAGHHVGTARHALTLVGEDRLLILDEYSI